MSSADDPQESVAALQRELQAVRAELAALRARVGPFPPGHYHSPIPDPEEVARDDARLFEGTARELPGIDRNEAHQWQRFRQLCAFRGEEQFARAPEPERARYHADNAAFCYGDAYVFQGMLRLLRPRRLIEIGSGFSTAVLLDSMDRFAEVAPGITCVEPDPSRMNRLLRPGDWQRIEFLQQRVQDVPLERLTGLEADDMLFVDSSHVSKLGSDVNFLFFEVLPRLRPGVFVHVHDIPCDFEYSRQWAQRGWAWNEAYLLRALLMHSTAFAIDVHPAWLAERDPAGCAAALPNCAHSIGLSIWLVRR